MFFWLAWIGASAAPATYILADNPDIEETHSKFFDGLKARGHNLTFAQVLSDGNRLGRYGEWFYDNLIIFAPSAQDFGEFINVDTVVEFIDSGRNVLVAVDDKITEPLRELANECGVDFDEEKTAVIDHFFHDLSDKDGKHTLVTSKNSLNSPIILGKQLSAPVLFQGIGHAAAENSKLVLKLLTGSETTYSGNPDLPVEDYPQSVGTDTLLVTGIQARNNARIVFAGSLQLFSNKFFDAAVSYTGLDGKTNTYAKSGNEDFAREVTTWAFGERGRIRASNLKHYKISDKTKINPSSYRIKDEIAFSIDIDQYDGAKKKWVPLVANDVQLEFTMIDPYYRITLKQDGKGHYSTEFTVPDVYGVFKFVVSYGGGSTGYSNLHVEQVIPVHPFRHNEFERFIPVAYPYYVAAATNAAAFLLFGIVFLFTKSSPASKSRQAE